MGKYRNLSRTEGTFPFFLSFPFSSKLFVVLVCLGMVVAGSAELFAGNLFIFLNLKGLRNIRTPHLQF